MAGDDDEDRRNKKHRSESESVEEGPSKGRCRHFARDNHKSKDCRFQGYRCRNCSQVGHIQSACTNDARKDEKGRARTLVEHRKGSTRLTQKQDATVPDKVDSGASLMQFV
eukprot:GHVQ01024454.1.p1 GENE.GHVQ01024454.1~~GHVQ01024454.1.p1  ORF type:complete len:111 (+),score=9.65 GHVQ01024454.1:152-484(+)